MTSVKQKVSSRRLEPVVKSSRKREGAVVQHRTQQPNSRRIESFLGPARRDLARALRIDYQHGSIRKLAQKRCIAADISAGCIDQDKVEGFAQLCKTLLQFSGRTQGAA